jgi:hypothetical protein
MFALKSGNRSGVTSQLVRERVLFLDDAAEHVLAVVEEFVKFTRGGQHLCPGVDQFEQICPGFVQVILPFGNSGSI